MTAPVGSCTVPEIVCACSQVGTADKTTITATNRKSPDRKLHVSGGRCMSRHYSNNSRLLQQLLVGPFFWTSCTRSAFHHPFGSAQGRLFAKTRKIGALPFKCCLQVRNPIIA